MQSGRRSRFRVEAWCECGVQVADEFLRRRPVDARIGDGDAVAKFLLRLREGLVSGLEITLKHRAHDRRVARGNLGEQLAHDVWLTLGLERPVVMGCSMGGAIVLKIAAEFQDALTGIVGLESSAYAPGRYNELLHHPAIHGGELCASYTYGLNSPLSPEASRRENWWYYSQSGPGVYQGDVHFYSIDWDARQDVKRIDTNRCKVALLTGEYDYSCTPAMSEAVAAEIPGSRLTIMKGMGHFPMIENYPAFRPHLLAALDHVAG